MQSNNKNFGIAIHGGAGTILREEMTAEMQMEYENGLSVSIEAGRQILANGGTALEAVTASVIELENNPLFNAGKGSVFNHKGEHEMDASIMYGKDLSAGAVGGVKGVKNPIVLAKKVLEKSEHILLIGDGAVEFAKENNIEFASADYFYNEFRHNQYLEALKAGRVQLDHANTNGDGKKFGTVGAVAMDQNGHLAAATSTGGLTNKKYGRIGDSPIIGAGTYANDLTCAISCTGVGELFIKESVAFQIHLLMRDAGYDLQKACDLVVKDRLVKINGEGGLIAINNKGEICLSFNSEGMYRAWANQDEIHIAIYCD